MWAATTDQKCQLRANDNDALVRVAYQSRTDVTWGKETIALAGRTLEEAFALENLTWCQDMERKPLQLRIPKNAEKDLLTLAARIHKRVQSSDFNKTDFALALLGEDPDAWTVPTYIAEGLSWLEVEIAPPETHDDQDEEQLVEGEAARENSVAAGGAEAAA